MPEAMDADQRRRLTFLLRTASGDYADVFGNWGSQRWQRLLNAEPA